MNSSSRKWLIMHGMMLSVPSMGHDASTIAKLVGPILPGLRAGTVCGDKSYVNLDRADAATRAGY